MGDLLGVQKTKTERVRCKNCGQFVDDGRQLLMSSDGTTVCARLQDCYRPTSTADQSKDG
jgi:hypothetical protein